MLNSFQCIILAISLYCETLSSYWANLVITYYIQSLDRYIMKTTFSSSFSYSPNNSEIFWFLFFNCYLAAPRLIVGHYRGDSLAHPMLITCDLHIRPEGHQGSRNEVGSLSPAERQAGFEPGTFRFWSQCLNPLGHSLACCLHFNASDWSCTGKTVISVLF